ncbi:MAG: hypothetical protein FK733_01795 [Asgard group archaeon]|nr:hypothetical protein [Asgard group archaeon]
MKKDRTLRSIVIILVVLLILTTSTIAYFFINEPRTCELLAYTNIVTSKENNSVFFTLENKLRVDVTILNKTQIELVNETTSQNPIDIVDEDLQAYDFPIVINIGATLSITCIFVEPITISGSYILTIYFNNGRELDIVFVFR